MDCGIARLLPDARTAYLLANAARYRNRRRRGRPFLGLRGSLADAISRQANPIPRRQEIEAGRDVLYRLPNLVYSPEQRVDISGGRSEIVDPVRIDRHDLAASGIHRR